MKKQLLCLLAALVLIVSAGCQKQAPDTPSSSALPESSKDTPQKPSFLFDSNRLTLFIFTDEKRYNHIELELPSPDIDLYDILDLLRQQYADTEYFQNESFGPDGIGILAVNSLTQENHTLMVDFKAESAPAIAVGSTLETNMLASVGATFIRNVRGIENLKFLIDGKPYESGHLSFTSEEEYIPPQG